MLLIIMSSGVGLDHYAEILRQKDYHWGDHLAPRH